MEKTMVDTLAALMLAGALSAVGDATPGEFNHQRLRRRGRSASIGLTLSTSDSSSDSLSPATKF